MPPPPPSAELAAAPGPPAQPDATSEQQGPRRAAHARPGLRAFLGFTGPAFLVAVGYMDPGNWATDVAAGSAFGYALLPIVVASSLIAMFLQQLSARLGIAAGCDLAQACRPRYSRPVALFLWTICELAIVACDLAEVVGSALALELLFGIPMVAGIWLTAFDALLILSLERRGFRRLEAVVIGLMAAVALCLAIELVMARPDMAEIAASLLPTPAIVGNGAMLTLAVGIIGATVMPHNLYLHGAVVQKRPYMRNPLGRSRAVILARWDNMVALSLAGLVNAAILILAASTFHSRGLTQVAEIDQAYHLLTPLLGGGGATLFALALLASGQNSTVTGTLAGQVVMEGFTNLRLPPWQRRLVSRLLAVIPASAIAAIYGSRAATDLLIFSQVVLSLQLPFAIVPLIRVTSDPRLMGDFVNSRAVRAIAWTIAAIIVGLNLMLLVGLIL